MPSHADEPLPVESLLDAVARLRPGQSRTGLRALLSDGRVTVNGVVVRVGRTPVGRDAAVRIEAVAPPPEAEPRLPFAIVHADDDLLVIDKPAGLLTSSGPREKRPTALAIARAWVARERPRARVGLVHRLDADASGLLVFSMNNAAHAALKRQFADHSAGREYLAIVAAAVSPASATIRSMLAEHADGTVHATRDARHGKPAVTHYETLATIGDRTRLRVTLETGRKHQIRAHLAGRGWPIVGDRLYGGTVGPRLMLTAVRLRVTHPTDGRDAVFEIEVPEAFA